MAALDDQITALTNEVTKQTTVDASAVALLQGISAQLAAALAAGANGSPAQIAALQALQTTLANNDATLAAAVVANTPASVPAGS